MIPSFDRGDRIRLGNATGNNADGSAREAFTNIDGVATDPTTVTLQILKPSGATLTYNWPDQGLGNDVLIREGTGRFYFDVQLDEFDTWAWQLSGTGTVETSETGRFHVRWSPFS